MRPARKTLRETVKPSRDRANAGYARAKALTPEERSGIARDAAVARWSKSRELAVLPPNAADTSLETAELPVAKWKGVLNLSDHMKDIPCYVLSDGRSLIGRTS